MPKRKPNRKPLVVVRAWGLYWDQPGSPRHDEFIRADSERLPYFSNQRYQEVFVVRNLPELVRRSLKVKAARGKNGKTK